MNKKVTLSKTFTDQAELDHFYGLFTTNCVAWEQSWSEDDQPNTESETAKANVLKHIETQALAEAKEAGEEIKCVWTYIESKLKAWSAEDQDGGAVDDATDPPATETKTAEVAATETATASTTDTPAEEAKAAS